jgi:hypothetical protein
MQGVDGPRDHSGKGTVCLGDREAGRVRDGAGWGIRSGIFWAGAAAAGSR